MNSDSSAHPAKVRIRLVAHIVVVLADRPRCKTDRGAAEQERLLPGQYADKETNTFYNYYRDYDPTTGRYL